MSWVECDEFWFIFSQRFLHIVRLCRIRAVASAGVRCWEVSLNSLRPDYSVACKDCDRAYCHTCIRRGCRIGSEVFTIDELAIELAPSNWLHCAKLGKCSLNHPEPGLTQLCFSISGIVLAVLSARLLHAFIVLICITFAIWTAPKLKTAIDEISLFNWFKTLQMFI